MEFFVHILLSDAIVHAIGFENFCGFESFPWTMHMSKLPAHGGVTWIYF